MSGIKAVKGGKTENEFDVKTITLRGVEYTITEIDLPTYRKALEEATDKATGYTPYAKLLEAITFKAVSPSPLARSKPMPYSVYRTLENLVEKMHFVDLPDEVEPESESEEPSGEDAPNS